MRGGDAAESLAAAASDCVTSSSCLAEALKDESPRAASGPEAGGGEASRAGGGRGSSFVKVETLTSL